MEKALFGAGCFWGVEETFCKTSGVIKTLVGYSGGKTINPSYESVCRGNTNHTEVVFVEFDNSKISFEELLLVFWKCHDPTTLNRQGPDIGTQYRSAIFFTNDQNRDKILSSKEAYQKELNKNNLGLIETEIKKIDTYYYAEDYHQQYLAIEGSRQYCSASPTKVKLGSFNGSNYKLPKDVWNNFNWKIEKCVLRSNNKPIEINN